MLTYGDMPPLPHTCECVCARTRACRACVIERDFSALKTRHWWCCVWVFVHSTQCIAHAILIAMRTTAECAFKSKCWQDMKIWATFDFLWPMMQDTASVMKPTASVTHEGRWHLPIQFFFQFVLALSAYDQDVCGWHAEEWTNAGP